MRDYSIEWDFDYEGFEKALDEGRPLHSLCITEEFLNSTRKRKLSVQRLEAIFSKVSEMWTLEGVYLALQTTHIPGRVLPLAINPGLRILKVHSGLEIDSQQGCEILAATLKQNGLSLKQISLLNLKIKLNSWGQWGRRSHSPILDPLLQAVPELEFLEIFEVTCHESQQNNQAKPHVSVESIRILCQSLSLKRFNLSNLGLNDEHFMAIAQELSIKPPTLQELLLNENFNTELGIEMIIRMLLNTPSTTIRTFQAFQKNNQLSPACVALLQQVLKKNNTALTNLSISTTTSEEMNVLNFYEQLNLAGRHLFLDETSTAEDWIRLLESVNDDHSMIFYCLRQSKFWWNYIGLGRSLSRPLPKLPSVAGTVSGTERDPSSDNNNDNDNDNNSNNNNNNDKDDDKEEDKEISKRFKHQLEILGMPEALELDIGEEGSHDHLSSYGSDSYLDDLYRRKDTLIDATREEALEEAHDIYEKKYGKQVDEKAFLEIFYGILSEKEKQTEALYRLQDELIQEESERIKKKNDAEKEAWMKERDAIKRRKRETEREAKEKHRKARVSVLRNDNKSKNKARTILEQLQSEAEDMRETWKVARQKTRAAKKKDVDLYAKLKVEEEAAFNKWVEKRQEVKSAEAKVIQETEDKLKRRQTSQETDAKTGGSVEDVWEAWSKLEEEAQQIANESARNSRVMSSGSISGMS
jgi:hypothetical protein